VLIKGGTNESSVGRKVFFTPDSDGAMDGTFG